MATNSLDTDAFHKLLFESLTSNNWNAVDRLIKERESFFDISQANPSNNQTILHYACDQKDPRVATPAVENIFKETKSMIHEYDEFKEFVNKKDNKDRTALDIALKNGHNEIVKKLLQENADVTIKFDSKVNRSYHKVLSKFLDDGLRLTDDEHDKSNEYLWNISCKFSTLTGYSTKGNYRETKTLAKVLTIKNFKHFELFLQPAVLIFVHAKCAKYKWLMGTSFGVHFLWYLLAAIYFYGTLQVNNVANVSDNVSSNSTDTTRLGIFDGISSKYWFQFIVFPCMFAVMAIKEVGKIVLTTTTCKRVYISQLENWGKLALLGLVFFGGTSDLWFWAKFVGIVLCCLLILKLFTKTDFFGLRLQILYKGFVLLIGYIFSFLPVLFIFMVIFSYLLLPKDINPFLRLVVGVADVFSKLSGELNFNDVFSVEKLEDEKNQLFILMMAVIYFLFILFAVLVHNVLLGEVVDNMPKIRRKAIASHTVTRLQAVYTWESLLFGKVAREGLKIGGLIEKIAKLLSVGPHGTGASSDDISYTVEFVNLPEYIREAMYKSKTLFPRGVNPEDHDDW